MHWHPQFYTSPTGEHGVTSRYRLLVRSQRQTARTRRSVHDTRSRALACRSVRRGFCRRSRHGREWRPLAEKRRVAEAARHLRAMRANAAAAARQVADAGAEPSPRGPSSGPSA